MGPRNARWVLPGDAATECGKSPVEVDRYREWPHFVHRAKGRSMTIGLHPDLAEWIAQNPVHDDPRGFVFPRLANHSGAGRKAIEVFRSYHEEGKDRRSATSEKGRKRSFSSFVELHSFRHGAASAAFKGASLKNIIGKALSISLISRQCTHQALGHHQTNRIFVLFRG